MTVSYYSVAEIVFQFESELFGCHLSIIMVLSTEKRESENLGCPNFNFHIIEKMSKAFLLKTGWGQMNFDGVGVT